MAWLTCPKCEGHGAHVKGCKLDALLVAVGLRTALQRAQARERIVREGLA